MSTKIDMYIYIYIYIYGSTERLRLLSVCIYIYIYKNLLYKDLYLSKLFICHT